MFGIFGAAALAVSMFVSPAAAPSPAVNTGTYTIYQIVSWDGGCLDITSATVGQRVTEAPCGSPGDLWWEYTSGASNGQLSPQGHPGISVGDAGGLLELRTAPSTPITYDDVKMGYFRVCFLDQVHGGCVAGTYWHANQSGNYPTLISNGNSNADYWLWNNAN